MEALYAVISPSIWSCKAGHTSTGQRPGEVIRRLKVGRYHSGILKTCSLSAVRRDADGCALEVCKIPRAGFTILLTRVNIKLIISVLIGF